MFRSTSSKFSVIALLFGLVVPIQGATTANATTTYTKTITVLGYDNTPAAGASVFVFADSGDASAPWSGSATTNSQGVAAVSIPTGLNSVSLAVEPSVSDLSNAIAADSDISEPLSTDGDQSISVQFRRSNIRVSVSLPDGTPAEKGIPVVYPATGTDTFARAIAITARTGAFGLALPSNLTTGTNFMIAPLVYQSALYTNQNLFSWKYGLRASGSSGSQTYTLYQDQTYTSTLSANGSNVYDLKLSVGNVRGQLKSGGNALTLPSGVGGIVQMYKTNQDGSRDTNGYPAGTGGAHNILANGVFPGRLLNNVAGRYKMFFSIFGSLTIPSFSSYIYEDSSGHFSLTNSNFSATTPYLFDVTVPTPTVAFRVVNPGTSTTISQGGIDVYDSTNTNLVDYVNVGSNGLGSIVLDNGTYTLHVTDNSVGYNSTNLYTLVVANGSVSSLTHNGVGVTITNGAYNLSRAIPNVAIKVSDSVSHSTLMNVWTNLWEYTSIDQWGNEMGTGTGTQITQFPDDNGIFYAVATPGTYVLELGTYSPDTGHGRKHLHMTVNSQGVASITDVTSTNGVLDVPLDPANLKMLLNTTGLSNAQRAMYRICTGTDSLHTENCRGSGFGGDGKGFEAIGEGTYFVEIQPGTAAMATKSYTVTVDSSKNVTIAGATKTNDFWSLGAATPNIKLKITNPLTQALLSNNEAWVHAEKVTSQGEYLGSLPGADIPNDEPGYASLAAGDGTYDLTIAVQGQISGLADRRYRVVVTNGVAVVSSGGTEVAKDGSGNYLVGLASSNFAVQLQAPNGDPLGFSTIDICEDTGNGPNRTGNCYGNGSGESGQISLSVAPGNYYVRVRPGSQAILAPAVYHMSVANDRTVTIDGASQSGDFWLLQAVTPNVSGAVHDPNGNTITFGNGQGIDLQLQKWNGNNRNWEWQDSQWRDQNSAGAYGFLVTGAGKYRFLANPQRMSAYASMPSAPFWVFQDGKVSLNENDQNPSNTLTNLEVRLAVPNVLLTVTDPRDDSPLSFGWINAFSIDTQTNNQMWVGNSNINSNSPGLAGFNFADGTYRLEINPQQGNTMIPGLSKKNYKVVISNNGSTKVVTPWGSQSGIQTTGGRYVLAAGTANITGRIVGSDGNTLPYVANSWININVQSLNQSGNWEWTDNWYNPDNDGYFNISVDQPGTYRLLLQPNSRSDAADTYSEQFTITSDNASTFKKTFGSISLNAPDMSVSVYEGETQTALTFLNIEIRQGDQWIGNANTTNGIASISFPKVGSYDLILHPNGPQVQNGFAAKTYHVTVTANSDGVKTATVASDAGATKVGNLTKLKLGTAALVGYVHLPNSGNNDPVVNANVVAIDSNGREQWQYSSNTSDSGKWAMSLPAGTYRLQARAPYGNGDYGSSDQIGVVTIAQDGSATLSGALNGLNPLNLNLVLKDPTWKGIVRAPGNGSAAPIPYANLCLVISNVWSCVQANQNGAFSISAPTGFTSFDSSAQLRVEDSRNRQYPSLIFNGATAVGGALNPSGDLNISFNLPSPNLTIHVTAGDSPAANLWVNVNEQNGPWLGGNSTNSSGDAQFYVDPSELSRQLQVQVDANSNSLYAVNYASATKTFTGSSTTIALATPNLHGIVMDPGTDGAQDSVVPYTWVELFQSNGQGGMEWKGGSNTSSEGKFSLFAPAVNNAQTQYIVRVNPSWNGSSASTSRMYDVTVNSSGNVTAVKVKDSSPAINASTSTISNVLFYTLPLATPSVQGTVYDLSNQPLANSWVQSYDAVHNMWMDGGNSRQNGGFGIALPDGTYRVQANVPWGVSGAASSSPCNLTIASGVISTGGACVGQDKKVSLHLRAPNITFTLKSGTTPMAFANVGIGFGPWNTNAQADSNGVVSLFLDVDAIAAANPGLSGSFSPYIWVNPPNDSADKMVQWNCAVGDQSKPICKDLQTAAVGAAYGSYNLGIIQVLKPNVTLHTTIPGSATSLGQGAWVTLVSFLPNGGSMTWAGSNTDSSGDAHFYIDSSTATSETRWGVTVDAPWDKKSLYSMKSYGTYDAVGDWSHGLTWSDLVGQNYSPATPNLSVVVDRPDGHTPNRYGWVLVEELNGSGNPIKGSGSGLDYNGVASALLGANKHYRITAFPNGGEGTQTPCLVDTDSSAAVTFPTGGCSAGALSSGSLSSGTLTISLNIGNVTGTIVDNHGDVLAGAIIVASVPADNTIAEITTTSNDAGRFGLQLDTTKSWSITVLPPGTTLANYTRPELVSTAGDLGRIQLVVRG